MKKLLFVFIVLPAFTALSQIAVTSSDFGDEGDTVRISTSADLNVDYTQTGVDQIWDFSFLVPASQYVKNYQSITDAGPMAGFLFGPFASPKYQASYYNEATALPLEDIGALLPVNIDNYYQVSRLTGDSLTSIGSMISIDGNAVPVKSDTIETRYAFPLDFGNTHFSRGYTKLDMNPLVNAIWIQYRTRATEVDGYGSITTPYGTFDALRVKHEINEIDSLFIEYELFSTWLPIPVPLAREYEWWTNGEKDPILKVTTTEIFGIETVTSVEYRDIYRGLDAGLEELNSKSAIYPNPSDGIITIESELAFSELNLYSMDGKIVKTVSVENLRQFTLILTEIPTGCYKLEIVTSKGKINKTLIRQ